MMTSALVLSMVAVTLAAPATLERLEQADYAQAAQTPKPTAPPERETPVPSARNTGEANIRLELTITVTDQRGTAILPPKTASIFVVDGQNARIRTGRTADSTPRPENISMPPTPVLNVDARPMVVAGGRIRVSLSFEYRPGGADAEKFQPIHINEHLSAVLEDGKPLIVSQTADPASDRIVKVELKATILK
jgi:hypothetical protein